MVIVIKPCPVTTKHLPHFINIIQFHSNFQHSHIRHLHISDMGSNPNVSCSFIQAPHIPCYYHGTLSSNIGSSPTPNTSNPLLHHIPFPLSLSMMYSPTVNFPLCFEDPTIVQVGFSLTSSIYFVSISLSYTCFWSSFYDASMFYFTIHTCVAWPICFCFSFTSHSWPTLLHFLQNDGL